ncbi:hypothetical protein QW060_20260 [Myroides ceti]|uniref:Lipoprotein n=1 Tax=Paenimyroides ceti TaxID=395087 RepID=A0ABT8CZ70_9FLAO|nr:hypothetical protein [Paenimyroides ceti]MDN3709351.1 hypothetical protein [Paenimyroides ceti]
MKKRFLFFLLLFSVLSCSKDEFYNPNPYLPNYVVDVRIPLSLPFTVICSIRVMLQLYRDMGLMESL